MIIFVLFNSGTFPVAAASGLSLGSDFRPCFAIRKAATGPPIREPMIFPMVPAATPMVVASGAPQPSKMGPKKKLQECYDREWFKTAPIYIIGMKNVNENWVRRYDEKPHGDIDVAIAAEHLCLAATEKGLGTCWVCNYDTEKMQQFFAREGYEAVVIIPVGHIAEDCPRTEKKRKEMSEITEEI